MKATGHKAVSGVYQWLINNIPYHEVYRELFARSAGLYHMKRPAKYNFLSDIDVEWIEWLRKNVKGADIMTADALSILRMLEKRPDPQTFIYLDPPYPASARRTGAKYYKHEMLSDAEHIPLLQTIRAMTQTRIMISTRPNPLYEAVLSDWRKSEFITADRAGAATEVIYMNYPEPDFLHQYDYIGDGCHDRQDKARKAENFINKLRRIPAYQRHRHIEDILQTFGPECRQILSRLK